MQFADTGGTKAHMSCTCTQLGGDKRCRVRRAGGRQGYTHTWTFTVDKTLAHFVVCFCSHIYNVHVSLM